MLRLQVHQAQSIKTLFPASKAFLHGNGRTFLLPQSSPSLKKSPKIRIGISPMNNIKAILSPTENSTEVKVVITVPDVCCWFSLSNLENRIYDFFGESFKLELVSAELDPSTGSERSTIAGSARKSCTDINGNVIYEASFSVPSSFGDVGAILVENEHHTEMYLKEIVLSGLGNGPVHFTCGSWVQSVGAVDEKRIFFPDKSYLPSQTPSGLKRLRAQELGNLQGNGQGERKTSDRIYDYDLYNDLGDPDSDPEMARPVLGGKKHPYPRRCRTGRPCCKEDSNSESRSSSIYVPRDEAFSKIKQDQFSTKKLSSVLHTLVPILETTLETANDNPEFPYFTEIDKLFNEGVGVHDVPQHHQETSWWRRMFSTVVRTVEDEAKHIFKFDIPETMNRDKFFWLSDEEFSRQTLAGVNPCSLKLVTEWPLKSTLDPAIYGPAESAITKELIQKEIGGIITVEEALKQKKLFILDYHDFLLPYVKKVRQLQATTLYGSRTLFFLNPDGTLRPLAIELTRPPMNGNREWRQVFSPGLHSTQCWLWRLAKAHVLAHDSGYHQLVSHWLRTHCCVEPYVIATNRQLSAMHPINRLLKPHFRYTMEINALSRQSLINAGGIIETTFSPGKYSMELSSVAYDKEWRFHYQALPEDLINRGLAYKDPNFPDHLSLTIEDYPFAKDGLDLWDALKQWVSDYVNHYYPEKSLVESDEELQAWWTEIRTVGHGDKSDEPWWPVLKTPKDLIDIITTIIWVTSGHHAAVNFGQYTFGGYFPNRPTIARTRMPTEDPSDNDWQEFMQKPERTLLHCFPTQIQATKVMVILNTLSSHSPDEEYMGKEMEPAWREDSRIRDAFERFSSRLKELEGIIDARNKDENLHNRNGVGIVPYELLNPFLESSEGGKGIPYSISI